MIEQAIVTSVSGATATVQIPRLTGMEHHHGPIPVLDSVILTPGDNVLVAAVGGIVDNWHVIGRLP